MVYDFYRQKLLSILVDVPIPMKKKEIENTIPIHKDRPMNTLLTKEIQKYNMLIEKIKGNLEQTFAAIEGVQNHTDETEITFMSLQYEKTPNSWVESSYPAHDNINSFLDNLIERYRYIKDLIQRTQEKNFTERKFWIPGFFSQKNLLTTLVQDVSRRYKISIEMLTNNFRIMEEGERPLADEECIETNSFYIDGLWIYGAQWDSQKRVLRDLPNNESTLGHVFPMIHLTIN